MAILGNNSAAGTSPQTLAGGRMILSKFTLASALTLTELHGWFTGASGGRTIILCIYADSSGAPGARLAYTSALTLTGSTDIELSETGFSVSLAAGSYWIGWRSSTGSGGAALYHSTGNYAMKNCGASDPPPDPFGTVEFGGAGVEMACWAVVGVAATPPVAAFSGTPLSGDAPLNVAFTDASTNTPTIWAWTFGDGGTSSSQNPSHNYTVAGTYNVQLTATNAAGNDVELKTGYVTVAVPGEPLDYAEGGGITIG